MRLLNAIRGSFGALRILSRLSGFLNLFCRRFDRKNNAAVRARTALPPGRLKLPRQWRWA